MRILFIFWPLLNPRDAGYQRARAAAERIREFVTTDWVLVEVADAMAGAASRQAFLNLLKIVRSDPRATIIPADRNFFDRGVTLYAQRRDKDWSLTDCISFVVMQEREMTEALTADHHFEQAGFVALLK